ncbi:MAG: type II secretion system protein M [Gammaproteobacteria bacterium]
MKAWLESLAPRERLMVMAAAALVALLIVYAVIWSPLRGGYLELRDNVAGQRDTAVWMQESAQLLAQLKGSGAGGQGLRGQSLLSLADSTARAGGLASALKRVEPEGANSVRVWLENASFDQLIQWLGSLAERYGVNADTVSMERVGDAAGRVNARLTLQAPGL